jgi:hypothetical protein
MQVEVSVILKSKDPSLTLEGLLAAQSRLSVSHPSLPILSTKQSSVEAGIGGEERVAEIFRKYSLPFEHHIIHDLSPSSHDNFQMDHNFFTPWYSLVLETKNISGKLEFRDNPPQLIRTREDGHIDGFESPVVQLERNRDLLYDFFSDRGIQMPIFGAIVIAYPKQIVTVPPANTQLLIPRAIPHFIKTIARPEQRLDRETFEWLSGELVRNHRRFIPKPISETYHIPIGDFKPGPRCVICNRIGMVKLPRTWHCTSCGANDQFAHVRTLREWFLVCKRSITNQECRWFLGVEDIYTANRILHSMNLTTEGKFRHQTYFMDFSDPNHWPKK